MGHSVVNVSEVEPAGPGGGGRFVRRMLGVEAFGINWFDLPPGTEGLEHMSRSPRGRSSASNPARPGARVAGPDGMTLVSAGARRGSYEPRGPF